MREVVVFDDHSCFFCFSFAMWINVAVFVWMVIRQLYATVMIHDVSLLYMCDRTVA